jgi:two-component system, LytTR family, response regulator AlgR
LSAIRALLVDDEPLARLRLAELLKAFEDVQCVAEADNGITALELIQSQRPDLVFLDIRMPGQDGLSVAQALAGKQEAPAIVFCTAYDDQALAAFDAQAVDYLVKPLKPERLAAAIMRVRRILGRENYQPPSAPRLSRRTQLSVRVRNQIKLIPLSDILYLLADTKYVEVHTQAGTWLLEESLVQLEEEFGEHFIRIHRSCLVAKSAVAGLQKLSSGETQVLVRLSADRSIGLDVSRRNLAQVKKQLHAL